MYFKKIPGVMLEWGFQFSRSQWGLESKFLINCKGVLILGTAPFSRKDLEACKSLIYINLYLHVYFSLILLLLALLYGLWTAYNLYLLLCYYHLVLLGFLTCCLVLSRQEFYC